MEKRKSPKNSSWLFREPKFVGLLIIVFIYFNLAACSSEQSVSTPRVAATPTLTTPAKSQSTPSSPVRTVAPLNSLTPSAKPAPAQGWQSRWLKGIPCKPPCWEGVTPGLTTAKEAVEIFQQSPLMYDAKLYKPDLTSVPLTYVIWKWVGDAQIPRGEHGGEAYYNSLQDPQIVYKIIPYLKTEFKLQEVIKAYGEPEYVIATAQANLHGYGYSYYFSVIYLSLGFSLSVEGSVELAVSDNLRLTRVEFFTPTVEGFALAHKALQPQPKLFVRWQGFKDFQFYCRDPFGNGTENCSKILKSNP
jgi:hypothetical protein